MCSSFAIISRIFRGTRRIRTRNCRLFTSAYGQTAQAIFLLGGSKRLWRYGSGGGHLPRKRICHPLAATPTAAAERMMNVERLSGHENYEELSNEPAFSKMVKEWKAYRSTGLSPDDTADLHSELCLKCGKYKTAHEGSCDGCRWKEK